MSAEMEEPRLGQVLTPKPKNACQGWVPLLHNQVGSSPSANSGADAAQPRSSPWCGDGGSCCKGEVGEEMGQQLLDASCLLPSDHWDSSRRNESKDFRSLKIDSSITTQMVLGEDGG